MARIDDPLDASEERVDAERRAESPVTRFVPQLAKLFDIIPLELFGFTKGEVAAGKSLAKICAASVNKIEEGRAGYLMGSLRDEVRRLHSKLEEVDEAHKIFAKEEFIPLVVDGLQKAEQTRGKSKIRRIAAILAHSLEVGPAEAADTAEEMMRLAMILSDEDVIVLRAIVEGQRASFNQCTGRTDINSSNDFWARLNGPADLVIQPVQSLAVGDRQSICAKLQSLGLLVQDERNQQKLNPGEIPYGLLRKGITFVEYIQSSEKSEQV